MSERLSPLDASFLHVESPSAHMHVAWKARFRPDPDKPTVSLERVRALVASRLDNVGRLRQRLAFPPGGFGAPVWVDDAAFLVERHVLGLSSEEEPLSIKRFDQIVDGVLSVPLERGRPLWEIHLAPWLEDGSVGVVMKAHHAMVDGISAVGLAMLILDVDPDAAPPEDPMPSRWAPRPAPGPGRMALESLADAGMTPMRTAGRLARGGSGLAANVRSVARALNEDVLTSAPRSYLNTALGPRRTIVGHAVDLEEMLAAKNAHGVTLNDVALTVVTGALRQLALYRGIVPAPLKAMVPVTRRAPEDAAALGNRISFVSVTLPVHQRRPLQRLATIHEATQAFKSGARASGGEVILGALGMLPPMAQARAAKLAASPRAYNLVVSNVPGPRMPVYLLGAEAIEAFPVVPLSDQHALSVGIFSLHDRLCFGAYGDPEALPQVRELPGALSAAALELAGARVSRRRRTRAA
jgi:WS/DGAT/MGAT family acyltransferase